MTERTTMNGKPVFTVPAKQIINMDSGFAPKLLCDGPTFSTGSACAYSCSFCYVPGIMARGPHLKGITQPHEDVVIRRAGALQAMRDQLLSRGKARYPDPQDTRVIYSSPLVDVAANMDLVQETIEACKSILELTHWHIRLLSKSNLLPKVAQALEGHRARMIYGVSTGTLDDKQAAAFEEGTPKVSKRLESLHWLQDNGFRTFGMICPSLPQRTREGFARWAHEAAEAIRVEKCEHVWAEVINARGESMARTVRALYAAGYEWEADRLLKSSKDKEMWEADARAAFVAHYTTGRYRPGQLRFLQYVTADTKDWWEERKPQGAILLGKAAH